MQGEHRATPINYPKQLIKEGIWAQAVQGCVRRGWNNVG